MLVSNLEIGLLKALQDTSSSEFGAVVNQGNPLFFSGVDRVLVLDKKNSSGMGEYLDILSMPIRNL
jgi:hypothetical protein